MFVALSLHVNHYFPDLPNERLQINSKGVHVMSKAAKNGRQKTAERRTSGHIGKGKKKHDAHNAH